MIGEVRASLYNRYRPASLDQLVGQEHVARALGNALAAGRLTRGYLFSGPRGTGKTTTARILARCLNCQASAAPTATPCGTCDSCRRTGHPDWLDVVEVDAASSARRIDEMRDWLESVRYAPAACRFRVTIMDEAHQITNDAASALLKTLEEPPPHLVVILCTTHPWDIIPTIRSRLQHYVLRKPGVANLVRVLEGVAREEGIETSATALDLVARAADGSYRDALGLLDQIATYADGRVEPRDVLELLGAVERESVFELVDLMASGDAGEAIDLLERVLDAGADAEQLMRALTTHLRFTSLLQLGVSPRDEWAYTAEELDRLRAQANQLPAVQVVRALDLIGDAEVRIRHGQADPRLQLELVAAKLARPELDPDVHALAARVEALETGRPEGTPPSPPPAPPRRRAPATAEPEPTPTPVAPPGPAPAAVTIDQQHLERIWPQIAADLEEPAPHIAGFLKDSHVVEVRGDTATVAVAGLVQAQMIGRPDDRARLEQALARAVGRPIALTIVVAEGADAGQTAPAQDVQAEDRDHRDLIAEIASAFDAVQEPIPGTE